MKKHYNSIQENHVREHMNELNADMSSSKTKGNPDRKVVGGRHHYKESIYIPVSPEELFAYIDNYAIM